MEAFTSSEGEKLYFRTYSNDEKQEAYENKYRFNKLYTKMTFEKYEFNITEGSGNDYIFFQFDTTRIYIDTYPVDGNQGQKYAALFRSGLLSPIAFACALNSSCLLPQDSIQKRVTSGDTIRYIDTYMAFDKNFLNKKYAWTGAKIYFSNIQELPYLEKKSTRVFKLEYKIFKGGPTNAYYYLELTNEKSNRHTPLAEFLDSAKLTFLRYAYTTNEI